VQEVRKDKGGTVRAEDYTFLYGRGGKDLQEVGSGGMDWIDLAQDRDRWQTLVNAVMDLRVP
jgi:hypothetical protein